MKKLIVSALIIVSPLSLFSMEGQEKSPFSSHEIQNNFVERPQKLSENQQNEFPKNEIPDPGKKDFGKEGDEALEELSKKKCQNL